MRNWKGRWRLGLGVVALALFCWSLIEAHWLEATQHRVMAHVQRPLTIGHLSDLHLSSIGGRERAVLSELGRARPDVIVITGDTVDDGRGAVARSFLAKLHAPLGVFAVPGNWEHWRSIEPNLEAPFRDAHVTLLANEARRLRDDVWLVGFDDATGGTPDRQSALMNVPPNAYVIGAMHSPAFLDDVREDADLVLAGHTHGGQVSLPLLGPPWLPPGSGPFVAGWYQRGRARMYVSRGVGTSILPVRFLCRPEVAVIRLSP